MGANKPLAPKSSGMSPNTRANANRKSGGGTVAPATATRFPLTESKKERPHVHRGGDVGVPRATGQSMTGNTVPNAGNSC